VRMQRLRVDLPAVIALGGNLGDREATLREAVAAVRSIPGVTVTGASDIVETPALTLAGVDESAAAYLNAVLTVRTALTPEELLDALTAIENGLGRVRQLRWGDRTIDLDIITVGMVVQNAERLTLPHPRAWQRGFVLVPWLQVDPHAVLPGVGRVSDLVAQVTDTVKPFPAAPLLGKASR